MNKINKFELVNFGKYFVGLYLVVDACFKLGAQKMGKSLVKGGYTVMDKNGNKVF